MALPKDPKTNKQKNDDTKKKIEKYENKKKIAEQKNDELKTTKIH